MLAPGKSKDAESFMDVEMRTDETTETIPPPPRRAYATREPAWDRFDASSAGGTTSSAYQRQYSHVYESRLRMLRKRCWDAAPDDVPAVERVLDLKEDALSVVVGTIIKEPASTSASGERDPPMTPGSYCRKSDSLYLEDQGGRMILSMNGNDSHHFCTGLVLGVVGKIDALGKFGVERVVYPIAMPHPNVGGSLFPSSSGEGDDDDDGNDDDDDDDPKRQSPKLLLLSGLHCGDPNVSSVPLDMLISYLQGHFTLDAKHVCRIIIAGGGPAPSDPLNGVRALDAWLAQVVDGLGVPVDVLPGKTDPTTANWPQRPLHISLFRHVKSSRLLGRSPNPYAANIGTKHILGTDGENILDLCKAIVVDSSKAELHEEVEHKDMDTDCEEKKEGDGDMAVASGASMRSPSELEALERTLRWGHICPTGPNSVPTVPHIEDDPMVISVTPHIYFAGGCSAPATMLVEIEGEGQRESVRTRLVCVPTFATTGKAVLVDLETLDVEVLHFQDDTSS